MSKHFYVLALFTLVLSTGCTDTPIGEASCRLSARGSCPEVVDRTLFIRTEGTISYYGADGVIRSLESTQVRKGTWRVDKAGTHLIARWPFAGNMEPFPLSLWEKDIEIFDGDPAGVKLNNRGFYIVGYDKRPFSELAKLAKAR